MMLKTKSQTKNHPIRWFLFGGDGGALRAIFGLLALCASQPFGSASRPLKTPTQRRFFHAASSPLDASQTKNHPIRWFLFGGDGGALRATIGLLALCASQPFGSASLPLKTPTQRRFLHAASSPLDASQTKNHPIRWFLFGGDGGARTHDLFDVNEAL